MSRVGKAPVAIPSGVSVTVADDRVAVKGPKGELSQPIQSAVTVAERDGAIVVERGDDEKISRSQHGLMRSLVQNMVTGVTEGFSKKLEVNGVGFRVQASGRKLTMSLGFSHDVVFEAPEGIDIAVDGNTITVSGIDKQLVGQTAADIRSLKKPEPYKGKGIKYADEVIIRKAGKTAGSGDKK